MRRWLSLTMLVSLLAVCSTWHYAVYGWVQATCQAFFWGPAAAALPRTKTFLYRSFIATILGLWSFYLLSEYVFNHELLPAGILASLIQLWVHNLLLPKVPTQVRAWRWQNFLLSGVLGGWATEVLLGWSHQRVESVGRWLLLSGLLALMVWLLLPLRNQWRDFWGAWQQSPAALVYRPPLPPPPAPGQGGPSRHRLTPVKLLWLGSSLVTVAVLSGFLLSIAEPMLISAMQVGSTPDAFDRDIFRVFWIWGSTFAGLTGAAQTFVLQFTSRIKAMGIAVVCNSWGVVIFPTALVSTLALLSQLNGIGNANAVFVVLFLMPVVLSLSGLVSAAMQEFLRSSLLDQDFHWRVVILMGLSFGLLSLFMLLFLGALLSGLTWHCC